MALLFRQLPVFNPWNKVNDSIVGLVEQSSFISR